MIVFYHPDAATYAKPGHPERPARVTGTATYLQESFPLIEWRQPGLAPVADLLLAHTEEHLRRLDQPEDFDEDTAYHPGISAIARLGCGGTLAAMERALAGHPAFSLMRPPGHHATADRAMGFCYLSNVAIAALKALSQGVARVAVWDFDAHHGNGTEAILRGVEGSLFVSVHQHPCYPGTGTTSEGNCRNIGIAPHADPESHMEALAASWREVLAFEPELILVSAGFDAYEGDPITQMSLRKEDFVRLGQWVGGCHLPVAASLEGGYSPDLPYLAGAFLEGWTHG
jgi:acetoin utilization deacetylase AcuC-like enzyme